jgi:outer membrane lipoprotein-sorting protein
VILIAGCGKKSEDGTSDAEKDKKDGKTGTSVFHIKYDIKGDGDMTLDMYVKDNNFKMDMKGTEASGKKVDALMFVKDKVLYMVAEDAGKKMGLKFKVDDENNEFKDITKLTDIKDEISKAKKEGTEKILDYDCDIYKEGDKTMWVYNDMFFLKMVDSKNTMVATVFEPDAKISDSDFDLPKDIEFQDMEELMKGLQNLNK